LISRDVTEYKLAEEALQGSEKRFEELAELLPECIYEMDLSGGLTYANQKAFDNFGYSREDFDKGINGFQMLIPDDRDRAKENIQRILSGEKLDGNEYTAQRKDGSTFPVIIFSSAIIHENKPVGLRGITVDITKHKQVEAELKEHRERLEGLVEERTSELKESNLQLQREIGERKRVEEALRESEKRFRTITESALEWIWEVDAKGKYTYVSSVVEKILGYKPEEVLKKHFYDLFHPEDRERLKKAAFEIFDKKEHFREFINRNVHKNGKTVWLSTSGVPIFDEKGNLIGYRGAGIDVTERKHAEEKLRKSEEEFRLTFENAKDAIIWADTETGLVTKCNKAAEILLEKKKEEILGHHQKEVHPPAKAEYYMNMFKNHVEQKGVVDDEAEVITKSGKIKPVHITASVTSVGGKPIIQGIFRDITERKQSEKSRRESEKQYRTLQSNVPVGVFRTSADPGGHILSANPALSKMLGYENPEAMSKTRVADFYLNADDRKKFIETISSAGEISNYEVQLKRTDGTSFWGSLSARAIADKSGKITYFDGILEDITERKQAEKRRVSIYKISEAVHSTKSLEEFYLSIHGIINELMPAKNFYIALYDANTETITFEYYVDEHDKKPRQKSSRKLGRGLTEYVLRTGEPLLATSEIFEELVDKGEIELLGPQAIDWLGVPLKAKDKIIGVLTVQNYTEGIRFGEKDMDILKFVSTQMAMAIERKGAEKELRESEEKYRRVVDNSLVGLYITQNQILKFCNLRLAEMFGYRTSEELVGKHIKELVAPESWKLVDKQVKLRQSGEKESVQYEFKGIKKNRIIFTLETLGSRIIYEGKPAIQGSMINITERKRAEEELKVFATTDVLTGVLNRGYALLLFGKQLQLSKRNNSRLSICYVDVDGLKDINDTYGHQEGDVALKLISRFLKETLREVDIVCRLGGDEFLLIFPQCPIGRAIAVWERIAQKVDSFNFRKMKPYHISLSKGFAEYNPPDAKSVDQLIALADQEMYKDKQSKSAT
ncbi:MAG: PAS domain S-box protein, partial [Candidatus Cloacimonadota bacterium]